MRALLCLPAIAVALVCVIAWTGLSGSPAAAQHASCNPALQVCP